MSGEGTAVVTGASRGFGRAVARRLSRDGWNVALVGRDEEGLRETADGIGGNGGDAECFATDLLDAHELDALWDSVRARLGPPSVLVHAAGVYGPIGPTWTVEPRAWELTLELNAVVPFKLAQRFLPTMISAGWGRIVYVASTAGVAPATGFASAYNISKCAMIRLAENLAVELVGTGVTANALHPGALKTAMWQDMNDGLHRDGDAAGLAAWPQFARDMEAWLAAVSDEGDSPELGCDLVDHILRANPAPNGEFFSVSTARTQAARRAAVYGARWSFADGAAESHG